MKGIERLQAIDRSALPMARALPAVPMNATTLVRLLRVAVIGMGQCFDRVFRNLELSEHAFHVLSLLMAQEDGESSPSDLCELVGATRTHMTRILDELVGLGLMTRQADARDGRRAVCSITPQGRLAALHAGDQLAGPLTKAFSGLSPHEMDELAALLRKAVRSFDESAFPAGDTTLSVRSAVAARPSGATTA